MNPKDVDALSINDLRTALKKAGLQNGPITKSTEVVYRAALYKHLAGLDYVTDQISLPNSNLEALDTVPASDDEMEETNTFPVKQVPLTHELPEPKKQFAPIRWNYKLQRYEPLYDVHGKLISEGDSHSKGDHKWLLLMGFVAVFIAIVIAVICLSHDGDPYKGLEDAASQVARSPGKVVVEM